jgi:hypothetical protein
MEPSRDEILFATLESLRPAPSAAFAAELDARAAAGFPTRVHPASAPFARFAAWPRSLSPRRLVFAGGGVALAAIAAVAVIVAGSGSGGSDSAFLSATSPTSEGARNPSSLSYLPQEGRNDNLDGSGQYAGKGELQTAPSASGKASDKESGAAGLEEAAQIMPFSRKTQARSGPYASQAHNRDVEYAAEMVLGAKPDEVGDAAGKVFDAVHQYKGIVLGSSVSGGSEGDAGAEFELLIPSAKLGDALAAFSGIAEVRSRHESSNDITAPTVTTGELLQDSHARIDGLLNELADTETETEREAVEAQLRGERRHAAGLKSQLTNLQRRASFSHVSLRIEGGAASTSPGGGTWGFDDAIGDAGHILAVAAAVAVVGLAVLAPIALILLLAWLAHRAWIRNRRERALG